MEYGTIIIGFVGRAKNGCDEPIASGVLELSSLVFGYAVFGVKGFAVVAIAGPDLNNNKNKRANSLLTTLLRRKGKEKWLLNIPITMSTATIVLLMSAIRFRAGESNVTVRTISIDLMNLD